jgi:hypothetical protein
MRSDGQPYRPVRVGGGQSTETSGYGRRTWDPGPGWSVTLVHAEGGRLTVCATDAIAEQIENLQDVLGEGPGPEAYESGEVVSVSLEGDQSERWPIFAGAVRSALGPVTIHAIPMRARGRDLGVLTLHQQQSRPLARPMREVRFLANAIGVALAGDRAESSDTLRSARDRISRGAGMVVAQLAVSPEDAWPCCVPTRSRRMRRWTRSRRPWWNDVSASRATERIRRSPAHV